jgi:hypothetical protein
MTSVQQVGPRTAQPPAQAGTLRARLEDMRARRSVLNVKQAVGLVVPLAVELADMHRSGAKLFVHASCLVEDEYGFYHISPELAQTPPAHAGDKACLAPEQRGGRPGDARASVYSIGAILYELLTGEHVGPGMSRPSELVSAIPQELEIVLAKALVGDPAHRPDDLNALAQALYNMAPSGSIRPPPADTKRLDHQGGIEVDVSMSMMPPVSSNRMSVAPYDLTIQEAPPPPGPVVADQTNELALLKARLEADPRPRYVVIKDGMDHGPFNAVEMLQQIATNTFIETDYLRESLSGEERLIKEWEEFAPFAEHARLNRDIKAEKVALERVVVQEARSTRGKALFGVAIVGALLAAAGLWFLTARGKKSDDIAVHGETLTSVDTDGTLSGGKGKGAGRGGVVGRSGRFPILGGGMSCEQAQSRYVEEMSIGGPKGQADLTAGQYGAILNRGGYLNACGVPDSMAVNICAAVQNGRAVGVTVSTRPRSPQIQGCIAGAIRRISFPAHPKLDVTRTTFQ